MPKWSEVLLGIYKTPENKRYCQKITRNVKSTINHIRAIVKVLAKAKLIKIIPTKKIKHIQLTEKGKEVATSLINIKSAINEERM
jgi:predicted transcriptional regulator